MVRISTGLVAVAMASGRASGSAVTPPPDDRTRGVVEPGAAAAASASGSTRTGETRSPPSGDKERAGPRLRTTSPPSASAFDHGAALGLPRPAATALAVVEPAPDAQAAALAVVVAPPPAPAARRPVPLQYMNIEIGEDIVPEVDEDEDLAISAGKVDDQDLREEEEEDAAKAAVQAAVAAAQAAGQRLQADAKKKAAENGRRQVTFDRNARALRSVGSGPGNTSLPAELFDAYIELMGRVEFAGHASRGVVDDELRDVVIQHFMAALQETDRDVAKTHVTMAEVKFAERVAGILGADTHKRRWPSRAAFGLSSDGNFRLEAHPKLYQLLFAGIGVSFYEDSKSQPDPNITTTPVVDDMLQIYILLYLDDLAFGKALPDAVTARVTTDGNDPHPILLTSTRKFDYNIARAVSKVPGGSRHSGTAANPNLVKASKGISPQPEFRGGSGYTRREDGSSLCTWTDRDDGYVKRQSGGDIACCLQKDKRTPSAVPILFQHSVLGCRRDKLSVDVELQKKDWVAETRGLQAYGQSLRLTRPISPQIFAGRTLPTAMGGIDVGVIVDSASTFKQEDTEENVDAEEARTTSYFLREGDVSDRDVLRYGATLHDVVHSKHAAVHDASKLDNADTPFPYPLLRSFDDFALTARKLSLAGNLSVVEILMMRILQSPKYSELAWRARALLVHEYAHCIFPALNEHKTKGGQWNYEERQLRALLILTGVTPVVGGPIRNALLNHLGEGNVTPRRRELEIATHMARTLEAFNPDRAWRVPSETFAAFHLTLDAMGCFFQDMLGVGGEVSKFPNAVDLSRIANEDDVARVLAFDERPDVVFVITVRLSDPRSLVDLERDKGSTQQLLTAAMAYRDALASTKASVNVRHESGRFVLNFISGSKCRLEDVFFSVFSAPREGYLHRAFMDIIFGEGADADAGQRALEAGRAAKEAEAFAAEAEAQAAAHGSPCVTLGERYNVPWAHVHGEFFHGMMEQVVAGNADVPVNTTYNFGRGYDNFPYVLSELLGREAQADPDGSDRLMGSVAIVLTAWADRIPAGGGRALMQWRGEIPVVAFCSSEIASILRLDPKSYTCSLTGGARLRDFDRLDEQEQSLGAKRALAFLENFTAAASYATMDWSFMKISRFPTSSGGGELDNRSKSVLQSYILELHAAAAGGKEKAGDVDQESFNAAVARFARTAEHPALLALGHVPDGPRRLVGLMRRSGQQERFGWQKKKLEEFSAAKRGRYAAGTTIQLDRVKATERVDDLSGDPRITSCEEHGVDRRGVQPLLVNLFAGKKDLGESAIRNMHKAPVPDSIRQKLDSLNARDRQNRPNQPAADVAFACISRVANPGLIQEFAKYARETGAKVFEMSMFQALMCEDKDVEDVKEERLRLRNFLLDEDGALKITEPEVEGFLVFLAMHAVSWRYQSGVVLPFWNRGD